MKYVEENSRIWDKRAENNDRWSTVVTAEEVARHEMATGILYSLQKNLFHATGFLLK